MNESAIILATKSPRRRELFSLVRDDFECIESRVDESAVLESEPEALCMALAKLKCEAVAQSFPGRAVVGCDTVVSHAGRILGKPRSESEAADMLSSLSGGVHSVFTGVFIKTPDAVKSFCCETKVRFVDIPQDEMTSYIATGDPYDKAGGYGIQGGAAKFVDSIEGDFFNVMGLPVSRLHAALRELGL